jgi:predicted nucleotidyltransferase
MIHNPTPYPDINILLKTLVSHIGTLLHSQLVGVYLYGSLVWGDFDETLSDIDLMVATTTPLNAEVFKALEQLHMEFITDHPRWKERIEIAYISVAALQTFKVESSHIAVISPGEPFHLKPAGIDWLINWYMVREKGVTLFGPAPDTLIPPISKAEFIEAVREQAKGWEHYIHQMRRRAAQAYGILTLCRALYACTFGEQVSKRHAALWAAEALPEWSEVIRNALVWREIYRDEEGDHEATFPQTLSFVEFMIARMATL